MTDSLRPAGVLPRRSFPRPVAGLSPVSLYEGNDEKGET